MIREIHSTDCILFLLLGFGALFPPLSLSRAYAGLSVGLAIVHFDGTPLYPSTIFSPPLSPSFVKGEQSFMEERKRFEDYRQRFGLIGFL
jgi:hypothetical protein